MTDEQRRQIVARVNLIRGGIGQPTYHVAGDAYRVAGADDVLWLCDQLVRAMGRTTTMGAA